MRLYKSKDLCAEWSAQIFQEMNWKWNDGQNNYFIPVKNDILNTLKKLEKTVKSEYLDWDESGRLIVSRVIDTGEIVFGIDGESSNEYFLYSLKKEN